VNDDWKTIPLDVKVGDHVLVGKYSGTEIKLDGEEYLIVREDEILGGRRRSAGARDGVGGRLWLGSTSFSTKRRVMA